MRAVVLCAALLAACASASPVPAPAPSPSTDPCLDANARLTIAAETQVKVCASLDGAQNDPTGACQKLIDATREAQRQRFVICTGQPAPPDSMRSPVTVDELPVATVENTPRLGIRLCLGFGTACRR